MPHSLCPLCGRPGCHEEIARCWPIEVRYECPSHCGTFRLGAVFLNYLWPAVHPEDKQAIATYMQATKGTRRSPDPKGELPGVRHSRPHAPEAGGGQA
jgi:hypothetical protein